MFYREAVARLKPDGLFFVATLNRTLKSYAFAILGAEYILRWLPKGTHDWKKFVRTSEMVEGLRSCGLDIMDMTGVAYSPLRDDWQLTRNLDINYMVTTARGGA